VSYFDMAVNEQCQQFDECAALDPFIGAGKAVFQVEYEVQPSGFCAAANGANRSAIAKTVELFDTPWTSCR
jgi:Glycoside-hydrolase family GH114